MLETGIEASIQFPKFKFPFLARQFQATRQGLVRIPFLDELSGSGPNTPASSPPLGWSYRWTARRDRIRYTLTPIDINYVYLPQSTNNFIDQIAPDNPLLRYSYEDHFIMRAGFNYYYTNKADGHALEQQDTAQHIHSPRKRRNSRKRALRAKFDFRQTPQFQDRSLQDFRNKLFAILPGGGRFLPICIVFNSRHALVRNMSLGLGVPYGNSSILPLLRNASTEGVPTA